MTIPASLQLAPRFDAYADDPVSVSHRLLGRRLVRVIDGRRLAGTIVEVEAYLGAEDRAAHTYGGRRTPRNESMYLAGGHAYVYFIYGLHFCLNVVCGAEDEGVAVLIRALEPVEGIEYMSRNRGRSRATDLCSGPAKLTEALRIDRDLDGIDLRTCPKLFIEETLAAQESGGRIASGPRIGVEYAGAWAKEPLRFFMEGNPHVSRP